MNESAFVDRRSTIVTYLLMHTRLYRMESEVSANNVVVGNKQSKLVCIDRRFKSMTDVSVISKKCFFLRFDRSLVPSTICTCRLFNGIRYEKYFANVFMTSIRSFRVSLREVNTQFA